MEVDLSVVIVTFNSGKYITKLLDSLIKNLPEKSEILIFDNASSDNTVKEIKKFHQVRLIRSSKNLGFAKANNSSFDKSKGKFILFLNPDTQILDHVIETLINFAKSEKVGIVAPRLIEEDGKIQPSVRKLPTLWKAFKEYYLGQKNSYQAYVPKGDAPIEVESVVGAAFLIRRDIFLKSGKFNEKYFMYFEDLELCKKVRELGYKIYYYPTSLVKHKVGASFSTDKEKWIKQSQYIYHGTFKAFILDLMLRFRPLK